MLCKGVVKVIVAAAVLALAAGSAAAAGPAGLSNLEKVGKKIFFDTNLSVPAGQACAACHSPETGFTGPTSSINLQTAVYPGAVSSRFGNRKPPTAAYGGDSPILAYNAADEVWIGGMFWDGRASGLTLGDPLAEQAQGPFINPLEQNMSSAAQVVTKVARSSYATLFKQVWGPNSLSLSDVPGAYERIARSIAAYERSKEVNPFDSKYDYWLKGQATLTPIEEWGRQLYEGQAGCSACHPSQPGPNGEPPLFTDFTFDNLGVPKNPRNPFYNMPPEFNPDGANWVDMGLGGFLQDEAENGKQKVPTLRNVDKRPYKLFIKAYTHNGYFKSLLSVVHFYNTRDKPGVNWPPPEVAETVNVDELGNLGLNTAQELAVVAFLKTLSDGWTPGGCDH